MRVIFLLLLFIHTEFALLCLDGNEIKKKMFKAKCCSVSLILARGFEVPCKRHFLYLEKKLTPVAK